MVNTSPIRFDIPVTVRVDQEFVDAVEEVRRGRSPIPSKSEIIREAMLALRDRERGGRRKGGKL